MKKLYFPLVLIAIASIPLLLFSACKRINESTELGGSVIPVVDNITTFDTTLNVQVFNDTSTNSIDSVLLGRTDEYWLGKINSDPIFGKTDARIFVELKPNYYKFGFENKHDSLLIDSVVLVLSYRETYGDSTIPQTVNVYEIDHGTPFNRDSLHIVGQNYFPVSNLLGSRTFTPNTLDDSIKVFQDTTSAQLRIRLDDAFGQRLLNYDSAGLQSPYSNDSLFRENFRGFAIQSMSSGNAIMGFDLSGVNTKLAIYYKFHKNSPILFNETTVTYFNFTELSGSANFVKRDYSGTPVETAAKGTTPNPFAYIQTAPGTFATIKIPGLASLSNRLVHRAELIVEQAYNASDITFPTPNFLMLDAYDPIVSKYRLIPYDLLFDQNGTLPLGIFGVNSIPALDGFGNVVKTWKFNISRYVQHILTQTQTSYDLRLHAPFFLTDQYQIPPGPYVARATFINQSIAKGRVRLFGNTGALDTNPHKMRLRIVYSKL